MKKTSAAESETKSGMGKPFELTLPEIALDPNNPRLGIRPAPGYAEPELIFNPKTQKGLIDCLQDLQGGGS